MSVDYPSLTLIYSGWTLYTIWSGYRLKHSRRNVVNRPWSFNLLYLLLYRSLCWIRTSIMMASEGVQTLPKSPDGTSSALRQDVIRE